MCRTIPGFLVPILCLFIVLTGASCKKSAADAKADGRQNAAASTLTKNEPETVGRLHWLGKKWLESDTNAAFFLALWNLPESEKLGAQTLDKLALAPWRIGVGTSGSPGTNNNTALFKELLTDLVREEVYAEVRNTTNEPGEFVMAVRLDPAGAERWRTNLASVLQGIYGQQAQPTTEAGGWHLKMESKSGTRQVDWAREGDWTLIGLGHGDLNKSFLALREKVQKEHFPGEAMETNSWLEIQADLRQLSVALGLGWRLPEDLPSFSLLAVGDGENVRSKGELRLSHALTNRFEEWNIPTNLIHDPLGSFTAIRELEHLVPISSDWKKKVGELPSQIFFWAQSGVPFESYFAARLPEGSNQFEQIKREVLEEGNAWLATNGVGRFAAVSNKTGAEWTGLHLVTPYLIAPPDGSGDWLLGGFTEMSTNQAFPGGLLQEISKREDLVYYDWELTGPRIEEWLFMAQLVRLALHKAQLPPASTGLKWLRALEPKLANCGTAVWMTDPRRLSWARKSGCGFSAIELHLFADWFESPNFPEGLHTFVAPPDLPRKREGTMTNAPINTNQSTRITQPSPK
jgi:hypothetical protein